MNVLDENIIESQCQLLRRWRIRIRQVGIDFAREGASDEDLARELHRVKSVTFFSRDGDFAEPRLCHTAYCIVVLEVGQYETASFIRRTLRHSRFRTKAQRMGKVLIVSHRFIRCYSSASAEAELIDWSEHPPRRPR